MKCLSLCYLKPPLRNDLGKKMLSSVGVVALCHCWCNSWIFPYYNISGIPREWKQLTSLVFWKLILHIKSLFTTILVVIIKTTKWNCSCDYLESGISEKIQVNTSPHSLLSSNSLRMTFEKLSHGNNCAREMRKRIAIKNRWILRTHSAIFIPQVHVF